MNKKKWSWQIPTNLSGKSAVHAACLFCLTVNILNCVVIISSLNLLSSLFFFLNLSVYEISSVFFVLLFCLDFTHLTFDWPTLRLCLHPLVSLPWAGRHWAHHRLGLQLDRPSLVVGRLGRSWSLLRTCVHCQGRSGARGRHSRMNRRRAKEGSGPQLRRYRLSMARQGPFRWHTRSDRPSI